MLKKGTKIYSVLLAKCPCCHEGDFYETHHPYNLKFDKMHKSCSVCGQDFEFETGFYYGAMYVSYGTSVVLGILFYFIMNSLFTIETWLFLVLNAVSLIGLLPVIYRSSRLIWINLFVKYCGNVKAKNASH